MDSILYGVERMSANQFANRIAQDPQRALQAVQDAMTGKDIAAKTRVRLAVERLAKRFFPEDVQKGLADGSLMLSYQNLYGTISVGGSTSVDVFTTSESKQKGVRNLKDRTTGAKDHFVATSITYKSVVNATLGVGAFGAPAADTLNGDIKLEIGTATIMENQSLRMFDRAGNSNSDNGRLELDTPVYFPPSTEVKVNLGYGAAPAANTQVQISFEGLGVVSAPRVK